MEARDANRIPTGHWRSVAVAWLDRARVARVVMCCRVYWNAEVVRRHGGVTIDLAQAYLGMGIQPVHQVRHVLPPVDVGVEKIGVTASGPADQLVEVGQTVRVDRQAARDR